MQAQVEASEGSVVVGVLDNDPALVPRLKCGDRVRVKIREIEDWICTEGRTRVGGSSIEAVTRAAWRRT